MLVPALLAGSPTKMADLAPPDRAWAVAGLRREGHTVEQIRERLGTSLRPVKLLMADPMTAVCRMLQEETETFTRSLHMSDTEIRRLTLALAEQIEAAARYKAQLDRMIQRANLSVFSCGCPRSRYNTYTAPRTGRESCRECRRRAVERHRREKKTRPLPGSGGIE